MAWPSATIKSWLEFSSIASKFRFGDPFTLAHIVRGQPVADWKLRSSLNRLLAAGVSVEDALHVEAMLLREFKTSVRSVTTPHLLPDEDSTVEWWCLMQHYGAPTRLLDWTGSPYVAAYFAVASHWHEDGALWVIHPRTLMDPLLAEVGDNVPLDPIAVTAAAPRLMSGAFTGLRTDRMIAQQGAFTMSMSILAEQEELIDATLSGKTDEVGRGYYRKFVIPKELKPEFLDQLKAMNVTANSLFPGLDGLGRSLDELARLACVRLPIAASAV